jgi:aspartate aminotransferase
MLLSKTILDVPASATFKYSARAKKDGVIDLTIGRPGFDTPNVIVEACKKALDEGKHHYGPAKGIPELRQKIAEKLSGENGIRDIDAEKVIVSMGAKNILYQIFQVMLNDGDKVAIPDPSWVSYESMVKLARGQTVWIPLKPENGFVPDSDFLDELDKSAAKVVVINSPNNPTGAVYPKENLREIIKIAKANDMWIISDECYETIIFGEEHFSIGSEYDKTITVNAFSKPFSMTGWRLGYAACPEFDIIEKMGILQEQSVSNPVSFAQYGALACFSEEARKAAEEMREAFRERRDYSMKRINEFSCSCPKPEGAFYIFPYFEGKDDIGLADALLENGVGSVPGSPFGTKGRGCIRLSYGNADLGTLDEAFNRMARVKGVR